MFQDIRIAYLHQPIGIDDKQPMVTYSYMPTEGTKHPDQFCIRCMDEDGNTVFTHHCMSNENSCVMDGVHWQDYRRYRVSISALHGTVEHDVATTEFTTAAIESPLAGRADWITFEDVQRFKKEILFVTGGLEHATKKSNRGLCHGMYFRKEYTCDKPIKEAFLSICGVGFYHLYVNGKKVGERFLDSPQTDYPTGVLYSTFDVTNELGEQNAIMVALGNGRHIEAYGYDPVPRFIVYGVVRYADGSESYIKTDDSWVCSGGPIKENSIYEGEHYDARDEIKGWQYPDFSVAGWSASTVVPGYPLRAQMLPPIMVTQTIAPKSIVLRDKNRWIVDFGQNASAVMELRLHDAPRGCKVVMHYSELLDEHGDLLTATARDACTEDWYICKGGDSETYVPSFTYHGFRYAEIIGYPGTLSKDDVEMQVVHTALERSGHFHCTDSLFNSIHEIIQWSQRSNVMSIPTDCPQREERMGWLGDVQLVSEQAICNFDMAAFYRKFLLDIKLSQREDGALSDVTPPYWSLYPADPSWGAAYATILWNLYFYYGDTQSLKRYIDSLCRYVDFLHTQTTDGILKDFGKYGDWCPPGSTYPKQTPTDVTSSFFMLRDTKIAAEILNVLGEEARYLEYQQQFDRDVQYFNAHFNDHGKYTFTKMSPIDRFGGMTSQILPLALGIVPEEDEQAAVDLLVDIIIRRFDYHFDCGIVGVKYLLPVLEKYNRSDVACKLMSRTTYPSYGYMVQMGATTLWERWEYLAGMGMNSHNHIMFGSVDAWFYQYLGGIRSTSPAWNNVLIAPNFVAGVDGVSVSEQTIKGRIGVNWFRKDGSISMEVSLPFGVEATIRLGETTMDIQEPGTYTFEDLRV